MLNILFHKEEELTPKRFLDMMELWRTRGITSIRYSSWQKLGNSISLNLESRSDDGKDVIRPPEVFLDGGDASASIKLVDGKLEFYYIEDKENRRNLPRTEKKKDILRITKVFNFYYKGFRLPEILSEKINKPIVIKEYTFNEFDAEEPPLLELDDDGDMYLFFEGFPPENGKITEEQAENFITQLSEVSGISVYNEDVKTFIFEHADKKAFDKIVAFIKSLC